MVEGGLDLESGGLLSILSPATSKIPELSLKIECDILLPLSLVTEDKGR